MCRPEGLGEDMVQRATSPSKAVGCRVSSGLGSFRKADWKRRKARERLLGAGVCEEQGGRPRARPALASSHLGASVLGPLWASGAAGARGPRAVTRTAVPLWPPSSPHRAGSQLAAAGGPLASWQIFLFFGCRWGTAFQGHGSGAGSTRDS